jgi:hypothetical protein
MTIELETLQQQKKQEQPQNLQKKKAQNDSNSLRNPKKQGTRSTKASTATKKESTSSTETTIKSKGGRKFIYHLTSLVINEIQIDVEATTKLLSGSSIALQKRGVAILDLKVTSTVLQF